MRLAIETLPFLPTIDVKGTGLAFDAETATFRYQVRRRSSQHRAWAGEGHGLTGNQITKTETGPDGEQVEVKKPESTWRVLYADDALFAADSSKVRTCGRRAGRSGGLTKKKTGLCLVKRL